MNIDYSKITDNPKVIELLKQRIEIENKIKAIDKTELIKHELELLSLPDVVVPKGTFNCGQERAFGEERCKVQCKDCVIEYKDN
jgi:hypothetical protein